MMTASRPPPLVLMIYAAAGGGGYGDHLRDSGFRVAEAHNRDEGFEHAVSLVPDLIVLDFDLNSGLVARLRDETITRAIPIIALAEFAGLHGRRGNGGGTSGTGPPS